MYKKLIIFLRMFLIIIFLNLHSDTIWFRIAYIGPMLQMADRETLAPKEIYDNDRQFERAFETP